MFCPHCGTQLVEGAAFCMKCGKPIQAVAASQQVEPPKAVWRWRITPMRGAIALLCAFALFLLIKASTQPTPSQNADQIIHQMQIAVPTPRPRPVYGWAKAKVETFALAAGGEVAWGPVPSFANLVRYDIRASMPVNTGIGVQSMVNVDDSVFGDLPDQTTCYQPSTLRSDKTCPADGTVRIYVQDSRTASDEFIGGAGAALGLKDTAEKAIRKNTVTLTFYQWQCLSNCN